jgi:hypothetical protein
MQCNAMRRLQGCNLLCVRMYTPHRDRRLSCGGTGSRRVAAWLGWAAAWYSLFILLPVPMRWLVGLGEWECVSLHLHLFPTLSVAFTCFGFFPWSSSVCRVSDRNSRLQSRGTIELSRADHGVGWMNVIHGTRLAGCRCRCRG